MHIDRSGAVCTTIDPLVEQPCFAVNVQIVPGPIIRGRLAEIQEQVLRAVALDLFRIPLESLHVSAFPLLWVRGTYGRDPRELWDALSQEWLQAVARACDGISPFELRFSTLVATDLAVILVADEPTELRSMRDALAASGSSLSMPVFRPRIVHTTLFRYRAVASLREVTRCLQHIHFEPVRWTVQGVSVRQERVYPSLAWTEMVTIGFRNADVR